MVGYDDAAERIHAVVTVRAGPVECAVCGVCVCARAIAHGFLSPSLTFSHLLKCSQTLEDELRDLNAEYKHVSRTLQDPRAVTDTADAGALAGDKGLREIVLRMEHKSAQAC